MKHKKILVPILAFLVLLTGTLFVIPPAHAQGTSNGGGNFFSGLITFISQKFGLDKTQVQSAITDYQKTNKPTPRPTLSPDQMQAREKARLDKLVSSGKITSAQESLILAEEATLRAKYAPGSMKNMTADQRKAQFTNEQADIKAWASTNNIDPKYLMFGFGRPMMRGMRGGFGKWNKPTPTP